MRVRNLLFAVLAVAVCCPVMSGCSKKEKVVISHHDSDDDEEDDADRASRHESKRESRRERERDYARDNEYERESAQRRAQSVDARNNAGVQQALRQVAMRDDYSWIVCEMPLSSEDLMGLTKAQLRILRNTIYARHGRRFKSPDLQRYFAQFDWYYPTVNEVYEHQLSPVEKHNIQLIQAYE